MSESERLARLQSQNIQTSSGHKAGSTVSNIGDAAYVVQPSNSARARSWEKSSKWASEQAVSFE